MKFTKTYYCNIFIGFLEFDTGVAHSLTEAHEICDKFCDIGLCVTLTPTQFIYTGGGESGCIVGLINYPRFPTEEKFILMKALDLAKIFLYKFRQQRISIVTPEETIMLEYSDLGLSKN